MKVELKNDNVESFNTRWHETIIATKEQPDDENFGNLYYRQRQQSKQLKLLVSLYIQDTVQKKRSSISHLGLVLRTEKSLEVTT